MANKTTTNLKSQEQPMKTAVQLQLARIKIEEEEELWISGEELYTEGSSDEEEYKQLKSRRKINNNKSSRASPVNPNVERRSCSPFSTETKTSLDHSANGPMDSITKKQTVPNTSSTFDKTTSTFEKLLDSSVESQQIQHLSTTESPATCIMKDTNTSDFFIEENQVDNTEISWKAKKDDDETMISTKELKSYEQISELGTDSLDSFDLMQFGDELFDRQNHDEINISSEDAKEEWMRKQILQIKNLDGLIDEMCDKIKKAKEETLISQCENRTKLKNILSRNSSEIGKLVENTRKFFRLCPKYVILDPEFQNNNELNISLGINDSKQKAFRNDVNTNLVNDNALIDHNLKSINDIERGQWKIMNSSNDVGHINNKTIDLGNNPYIMDKEAKEILLELDKKNSDYRKDSCNDQEQFKKAHDSTSTNSISSMLDTVSTIETLRDIDKNLLDEIIQETHITDLSSIFKVAEDDVGI